jgi:hypothetical protein
MALFVEHQECEAKCGAEDQPEENGEQQGPRVFPPHRAIATGKSDSADQVNEKVSSDTCAHIHAN